MMRSRGVATTYKAFVGICLLLSLSCSGGKEETPIDPLAVVAGTSDARPYESMIHDFIMGIARDQYERRHNAVQNLINERELRNHQRYLRERLMDMIGGLPPWMDVLKE